MSEMATAAPTIQLLHLIPADAAHERPVVAIRIAGSVAVTVCAQGRFQVWGLQVQSATGAATGAGFDSSSPSRTSGAAVTPRTQHQHGTEEVRLICERAFQGDSNNRSGKAFNDRGVRCMELLRGDGSSSEDTPRVAVCGTSGEPARHSRLLGLVSWCDLDNHAKALCVRTMGRDQLGRLGGHDPTSR